MEELPIGSEITLKVVEGEAFDGCDGCFFDDLSSDINKNICTRIKCTAIERKDKKYVQFKRVK